MGERSVQDVRLFCESKRASGGDSSQCADLGARNELKKQRLNISINEMHMIELIAKGKTGMTVSEIAQQLKVTKPSVTVAVNKLVQKGYWRKQRLPGDGRAVQVMLTPEGKKVEAFHRRCHRRIIAEICEDLSEEEREELLRTMTRINSYFQTKL